MTRDIGQEILDGVRAIKRGEGKRRTVAMPADVAVIRERLGHSQSAFAALLGVSVRTLQDWEQGRRTPAGPALSLLRIAEREPKAVSRALCGRNPARYSTRRIATKATKATKGA